MTDRDVQARLGGQGCDYGLPGSGAGFSLPVGAKTIEGKFSHISMNWRGRPLTSHDVIVNSIAATTNRTGLTVHAELDPATYDTGIKVTDSDIDALPMHRHHFHGDWNYTLHPNLATPPAQPRTSAQAHAYPGSPARPVCARRR